MLEHSVIKLWNSPYLHRKENSCTQFFSSQFQKYQYLKIFYFYKNLFIGSNYSVLMQMSTWTPRAKVCLPSNNSKGVSIITHKEEEKKGNKYEKLNEALTHIISFAFVFLSPIIKVGGSISQKVQAQGRWSSFDIPWGLSKSTSEIRKHEVHANCGPSNFHEILWSNFSIYS